jgi:hypothetical protein
VALIVSILATYLALMLQTRMLSFTTGKATSGLFVHGSKNWVLPAKTPLLLPAEHSNSRWNAENLAV